MIRIYLTLTLFLSSFSYADTAYQLFGSFSNGKSASYDTTVETMSKLPDWDTKGEPPLSIGKAIGIAHKQYALDYGASTAKLDEVELDSKRLRCGNGQKCPLNAWFYKVDLKGEFKITYVVLMDGSVVKPTFK